MKMDQANLILLLKLDNYKYNEQLFSVMYINAKLMNKLMKYVNILGNFLMQYPINHDIYTIMFWFI